MEIQACGLPIVAGALGGNFETIRDGITGILVREKPSNVAGAIIRLLNNTEERKRMGNEGRRFVAENFSIEKIGAIWMSEIHKVMLEEKVVIEPLPL